MVRAHCDLNAYAAHLPASILLRDPYAFAAATR